MLKSIKINELNSIIHLTETFFVDYCKQFKTQSISKLSE